MENKAFLKVGRLNKTFGLKGHIRAFIEPQIISRLKKLNVLLLLSKNAHLPYFIDEADINESGHCMFHFEEVPDKTSADLLIGKDIYIDPIILKKIKPYQSLADFIGFKITDEQLGYLGDLENVTELPNHDVGHFNHKGKEILFPWNAEVIRKINKKEKNIEVLLPAGLLEIYLGS
ncbi:MAG: 16S rRNA processing protein RimM [Chitinophagales bacterium]|jgi:16S rRNA processing protein RimM|nr:16S rRNA processing protein RimM [Chitinophagales bacterium]